MNILCAFCGQPFSDKNVELYASASSGCPTCGPEITETSIEITCTNENCPKFNKVIYSKETE